ncbi:MAG: efflux RND transporter permease subunit [Gloeobacterales cyanobacterium]
MPRSTFDSLRERLNISRLAIQYSWFTICCWIVIGVAGFFAFSSLRYALFPDVTFPVVVVTATAPLETALNSEAQLTTPLEKALQPLEGLNKMVSSTSAGRTVINLGFRVGTKLDTSTDAVEERLKQLDLPIEANYKVIPLNLNEATAISYALSSSTLSLEALAELAEKDILPPLRGIDGVLRVDLLGTGSQSVAPGEKKIAAGLLANVQNPQNPPTLIRFNGNKSLALQVVKRGDANTLEVVARVEALIQKLRVDLPEVQLTKAVTQAAYIRDSSQATIDALLGAIGIAVLVILGFLRNWRATLITALAIPLSLLGTSIVMAISGFNLETITLLALALVIGIIVDDAIVEIENIVRHLESGLTPRQAALKATQEIGLTVSASTLTIVAVFVPVAFMGGTVGQFFKPFALTISAAVLTSLLVARTLSPVLAVYWLRMQGQKLKPSQAIDSSLGEADGVPQKKVPSSWLERAYTRLLVWALHHRWSVVTIAIVSFLAGIVIIPLIPQGFIPQLDRGEFYLNYTAPLPQRPNLTQLQQAQLPPSITALAQRVDPRQLILEQTIKGADALEKTVFQIPEVESVLTTVGGRGRPNEGTLHIQLRRDRDRDTASVQTQLRKDLPEEDGIITSVEDIQFVDTGGEKPLQIALVGKDLGALQTAATTIKDRVEKLPGFADVSLSGEGNSPDKIVEINRQNGERVVYLRANLSQGKALGNATDTVVEIAQSVIPADIRIDLGGDSDRANEVLRSFGRTLIFAIFCMLGVLVIPFGRLLEPAVIILSLPLSLVGAMVALLITQSDFGIVSLLGLLFLLGLLDKNALLLLDYVNQLRQAGLNRTDAILKTGLVRLRPIIMTTASSVLGMIPIALGLGVGEELRQPMAVAIIGGLLTSTLLSLIVVPVLYTLLEDGWAILTRRTL